ncbi:6-bladed beta-propeller [Algoriphagus halophilus]|uniref:6-bladed beta-propeller protein n=1 Tax=Algoriphagus halophilus TaxID=226505 RepID=A0A1N6HZW9_9BACT|nr:6-bladed beta-propeller [Algoriphagus halophilus]SIO25300.1 6-bladed beta-propeller protein [Algoriphagus halophilus]
MDKYKFIFSLLFAIIGCSTKNTVDHDVVLTSIPVYESNLEITDAILLETNHSNLLGTSLEVKFNNEFFWILDLDNRDGIHGFNKLGRYHGLVALVGEEPGKVSGISDFLIGDNGIETLTSLGDRVAITSFSYANNLKFEIELPYNCYSFEKEGNDYWIYSGYNKVAGEKRLKLVSNKGELKQDYLQNNFNDALLPFVEPSFFKLKEGILFKEALSPLVYSLDRSKLEVRYNFDFGRFQTPIEFWQLDPFEGFEMLNKNGFATINYVSESSDYFLVEILIQTGFNTSKELLLNKKSNGNWIKLLITEDDNGYFYNPIGIEGDKVIFISYAPYIVRNFSKLNMSTQAEKELSKLKEESNHAILYVQIPEI